MIRFLAHTRLLRVLVMCGFALAGPLIAAEVHVAVTGADSNPGTVAAPFATPEKARDAVRALLAAGVRSGPITVWLHDGTWMRRGPLELGKADSGTAANPVFWRAFAQATPRFLGGIPVPADALKPVTDPTVRARLDPTVRDLVRCIDLAALKVVHVGPAPSLFNDGGGIMRLFADDQPLPLARWPNVGYQRMGKVLEGGGNGKGGVFVWSGDRPARWLKAVDDGLWVTGFWRVPWVIQSVKVAGIDVTNHTITHAVPISGGIGSKYSKEVNGTRVGNGQEPWYVSNVIEELDLPGEWCLDTKRKQIVVFPPTKVASLMLVDDEQPLIRMVDASYLTIQGVTLIGGLGTGISVTGGDHVGVVGCVVKNTGKDGIFIVGGSNHLVQANDLVGIGSRPIHIEGGVRKTLTTSGHQVLNNHIHHYGLQQQVVPGIEVQGVGIRVANNLIHDGPNCGIVFGGNDHLIEYNEVHNIGLDSGDLGCIYAVLDWASRGTRIRFNFLHHAPNGQGIYLDDGKSGDEVTGNIIVGSLNGVFLSGGHDMPVTGNLILNSIKAAVHVDDRGIARGYTADSKGHVRWLHEYKFQSPPWSDHYPSLTKILEFHPEYPTGITIDGNVWLGGAKELDLPAKPERRQYITVGKNLNLANTNGFIAPDRFDYRLRSDSPILKTLPGFTVVPLTRMGLQVDAVRRTLPSDDETGRWVAKPSHMAFDSAVDQKASDQKR